MYFFKGLDIKRFLQRQKINVLYLLFEVESRIQSRFFKIYYLNYNTAKKKPAATAQFNKIQEIP